MNIFGSALEPHLPVFDAHQHFWDRGHGYGAADFNADIASSGHNVIGSIFIECHWSYRADGPPEFRSLGETEAAVREASTTIVRGVVANVDLSLGSAVADVLARHLAASDGLLRGIRCATAFDPSPDVPNPWANQADMLGDPEFCAGLQCVADAGLVYDALVLHPQISEVTDAARALPQLTFILGHLGLRAHLGPYADARADVDMSWRASMKELATCANVKVKISGIGLARFDPDLYGSRSAGSGDIIQRWQDDIRFVIDTFGPDRCMCGSNFPVDREVLEYGAFWNAVKRMTSCYTQSERRAILYGTALQTYAQPAFLSTHGS